MISKFLNRYSPPGMELKQEKRIFIWGMILSTLYSVFYWSAKYVDAYNSLFVYKNGKSYANKYLVMYIKANGTERNRIGISVSKKVGNSVVRHRVTRLVRESYRLHEAVFNSGLDIVIVARPSAASVGYEEIESALLHLAKLHKIIKVYFYFD